MDDDKTKASKNQSPALPNQSANQPIFQTTPIDEPPAKESSQATQVANESTDENLKPEEVAPAVETAEQASSQAASPFELPDVPPQKSALQSAGGGGNKGQFIIVGIGAVLFVAVFSIILFFILGRGNDKSEEPVKLAYWGLWEDPEVLEPLISEYQKNNPNVTVEYQKMAGQDYREKLIARSQNSQGPDIFRFHNTWLPEISEIVAPLPTSIMSNEEFETTFYPIHQSDLKIGDSYYGIPLSIDGLILVYNAGLFRKAGITSPPATWDDVVNYAGRVSVHAGGGELVTAGIALGTASNVEHFSDVFGLFLILNGLNIRSLDDPQAADVLEAYRRFAEPITDQNDSPINVWDEQMPNSIAAFIQEKVAMIIVPSWEILVIKAANPDIELKVAPIPVIPGIGNAPKSIASYWVEGVTKTSKHQLEAWKFLKFLSEKETMTKLYENQTKVRLFGTAYSRVDLKDLLLGNEYLGAVILQANSYESQPTISRTFDNGLNDEINQYIENAINETIQGSSYQGAMQTAHEGISKVLEKFKIN